MSKAQQCSSASTPKQESDPVGSGTNGPAGKSDNAQVTLCGDEYLLVPKPKLARSVAADDVKSVVPKEMSSLTKANVASVGRLFATTLKRGARTKATLVLDLGAVTGTAATALTTSIPCDLTGCGDYSSWLNLFDEVRVNAVKLKTIVGGKGSATVSVDPISAVGSVSFDPCDATAPSSVQANIKATHHLGPFTIGNSVGTTIGTNVYSQTVANTSNRGYMELGPISLVPQLPKNSAGTMGPSPVGSDWVPTTNGAIVAAYFKFYCEAPAANLAWAHRSFVFFDVEFRMRG
jgi:hypothetical protein